MINQHQFEQSARHFRSGRISLKEFKDRVFSGQETAPHETKSAAKTSQSATPITIAAKNKPLAELSTAVSDALSENPDRPILLTGVASETGQSLLQEFSEGDLKLIIQSDILLTRSV